MGNVFKILILLLITSASFGQVMQVSNGSRVDQRYITTLGFRLPQVCWVTGNPNLLNYSTYNSKGAMVYDTCAGKIKRWDGSAWVAVQDSMAAGGGGDYVDTIYRKAGQDSIFFTINGGTERAIKDSLGGAGTSAINYIASDSAYVGTNSGVGGTGTDGGANNSKNILIGARVGFSMTTGTDNYSFGDESLYANTQGSGNFAFGRRALARNTTGSRNVAIGDSAKFALNGSDNIAIGTNAMKTGATSTNIAIGSYTLENLPTSGCTACGWVVIGHTAAQKHNTAATVASTVVGGYAAANALNISSSAIFGGSAYASGTGDVENITSIGHQSFANTTGNISGSTALGYRAGFNVRNLDGVYINGDSGSYSGSALTTLAINGFIRNSTQIAINANVTTTSGRQLAIKHYLSR